MGVPRRCNGDRALHQIRNDPSSRRILSPLAKYEQSCKKLSNNCSFLLPESTSDVALAFLQPAPGPRQREKFVSLPEELQEPLLQSEPSADLSHSVFEVGILLMQESGVLLQNVFMLIPSQLRPDVTGPTLCT